MPQRVSVVRVSLGEGVGYVLDLTAEVLALFDKEGERKTYLILQEILAGMRLLERASMGRQFHNAVQTALYTAAIASGHLMTKGMSANGRTSTRSSRRNSSGCMNAAKCPCPLNQCHTLDGRDNVIEKISTMPIR